MKYTISVIVGLISVFLLSFLLTPYLSDLYASLNNIEPGPDGESELFSFLLFVQWPLFFIIGCFLGCYLYSKCLTKRSTRTP